MKKLAMALLAFVGVVGAVRAADPAYVGKWKVNVAKSRVVGDTVTISNVAGGMMQFSSQGFTYTFKVDGKEYPTPDGGSTAWTATSNDVWDVANRVGGKVTTMYHLALKGDVLTGSGKNMRPDGTSIDFTSTYKRVSGGPGFAGKWLDTEAKPPVTTLEIAANGSNGVMLKDEMGGMTGGQFDGKDNPVQGPLASPKATVSFRKLSPTSFEVTSKVDGKSMYVDVYTVSSDGKTLTDNGTPSNAKQETYKVVFDRQ